MLHNNRFPKYEEKKIPPRVYSTPKRVGNRIVFVNEKPKYPYEGVNGDSLGLRSQLENGTLSAQPAGQRKLEKASGADVLNKEIEKFKADLEANKSYLPTISRKKETKEVEKEE